MAGDPHVLVALVSATIGHKIHLGDADRNHISSIDLSTINHGIVHDRATNLRTFPVLDAIASLSVSAPESQVIAVALQMDNENKEVRLTIAENGEVSQDVIDHITEVWAMMRTLSDINNGLLLEPHSIRDPSPPVPHPTALTGPYLLEMTRQLYSFSIEKILKRFNKWWGGLKEFEDKFKLRKTELPGSSELKQHFLDMVLSMDDAHITLNRIVASHWIPEVEWDNMITMMDGAVLDLDAIFDAAQICEVWAVQLNGYYIPSSVSLCAVFFPLTTISDVGGTPFRLRRALEKLTTHHRHVQVLISFAHSPRLRPAFEYRMVTVAVPAHPAVDINLPSSPAQWSVVLQHVLANNEAIQKDWIGDESKRLTEQIYGGSVQYDRVHCECALVCFLETPQAVTTPPFNYIGVSKLSCRPCHEWLIAFNRRGGRQYHTRGCHGKWYWPWTMSASTPPDMLDWFTDSVVERYITYQRTTGRVRSASDSSDASGKGAKPLLNAEKERSRHARLEQLRAASGGSQNQ